MNPEESDYFRGLKEKDVDFMLMFEEGCIKVGAVTLWRCSQCSQWHAGSVYKCPFETLPQVKVDVQIMKSTLVELRQRLLRIEKAATKAGWVV
jgi:hypothetical protein